MASDRPLRRKLIRLFWRIRGRRARAHFEETWPGLELTRAGETLGQIVWRGSLIGTLEPARAAYGWIGKSPVIIGSGPSLRELALEGLHGRSCLLLNGALSILSRVGPGQIGVIEDERFIARNFALVAKAKVDRWILSPAVIRAIAERDAGWFAARSIVLAENIAKPFDAPRRTVDKLAAVVADGSAALSRDPGAGVVICGTVAFTALQFALASQARDIALAGVDLTNFAAPRVNETAGSAAWSGLEKGLARILAHFSLGLRVAQERKIDLTCLSRVSRLLDLGIPLSSDQANSR